MMKLGITFNGCRGMDEVVAKYASFLADVAFQPPTGLSAFWSAGSAGEQVYSVRLHEFLSNVARAGVKLVMAYDLLCIEDERGASDRMAALGDELKFYGTVYGVRTVRVASPSDGVMAKSIDPAVRVHCSANMFIGASWQVEQVRAFADVIVLDRDVNRDVSRIAEVRRCFGKEIRLVANEGCLFHCANRIRHLSRLSHLGPAGHGALPCVKAYGRDAALPLRSPIIRPEDVARYEGIADSLQIETAWASTAAVDRILGAYTAGRYRGNLCDLLSSPGLQGALAAKEGGAPALRNEEIPGDYFDTVSRCRNECDRCRYCDEVARKAMAPVLA